MKGGIGLYEEINEKLDLVLKLNHQKRETVKTAFNAKCKTVGRASYPVSPSERLQLVQKVTRHYDTKIGKVYEGINEQLTMSGKPTINNPFLKGDLSNEY